MLRPVSTVPASSSSPPEVAGGEGARPGAPGGVGPDGHRPMSLPVGLVRLARPKQWAKNVLVFAAPAAAGVLDNREWALDALVAFVCFCLAASGTYYVNDARDVEADRRHPTKRHRPVASGAVPVPLAYLGGAAASPPRSRSGGSSTATWP